jgi:hypothetical protein
LARFRTRVEAGKERGYPAQRATLQALRDSIRQRKGSTGAAGKHPDGVSMKFWTLIVVGIVGLVVLSFVFRMLLGTVLLVGLLGLAGVGTWALLSGGIREPRKKLSPGSKLQARRIEKQADRALQALKKSNPYEEAARRELESD